MGYFLFDDLIDLWSSPWCHMNWTWPWGGSPGLAVIMCHVTTSTFMKPKSTQPCVGLNIIASKSTTVHIQTCTAWSWTQTLNKCSILKDYNILPQYSIFQYIHCSMYISYVDWSTILPRYMSEDKQCTCAPQRFSCGGAIIQKWPRMRGLSKRHSTENWYIIKYLRTQNNL